MDFQSLVELAPWTTIAQICNLLLQIFLFKKFLFKPIKEIIAKRQAEVDGVYDADPRQNAGAVKYNEISYDEVISKGLGVMDLTAVSLAKDNRIPIVVFAQKGENALLNAVTGQGEFTIIK